MWVKFGRFCNYYYYTCNYLFILKSESYKSILFQVSLKAYSTALNWLLVPKLFGSFADLLLIPYRVPAFIRFRYHIIYQRNTMTSLHQHNSYVNNVVIPSTYTDLIDLREQFPSMYFIPKGSRSAFPIFRGIISLMVTINSKFYAHHLFSKWVYFWWSYIYSSQFFCPEWE